MCFCTSAPAAVAAAAPPPPPLSPPLHLFLLHLSYFSHSNTSSSVSRGLAGTGRLAHVTPPLLTAAGAQPWEKQVCNTFLRLCLCQRTDEVMIPLLTRCISAPVCTCLSCNSGSFSGRDFCRTESLYVLSFIHSIIHSFSVTGTNPSCLGTKAGLHPGQVASLSQGHIETQTTTHTPSLRQPI